MLTYMVYRNAHHQLNDWLDRNGYRHSHARRQETPHPYGISPRISHAHIDAHIDEHHPYVTSPRMAHARIEQHHAHMAHAHMDQEPIGICILVRSDAGDGAWSLHAPGTNDHEIADESAPPLVSGEASWRNGQWSRPDERDYDRAVHALRRKAHARMIHQEPTGRAVFAAHERNHHITTSGRRALKRSQFALPPGPEEKRRGIKGRLPIDSYGRARSALARASMMHHQGHITAKQLMAARRTVHKVWPSIGIDAT